MNAFTPFFAALIVIAHLAVIFWPRKPLQEVTDENGLPLLWHNQDDERKDVTCVWREAAEQPALGNDLHAHAKSA
jgi:hypothetical protein